MFQVFKKKETFIQLLLFIVSASVFGFYFSDAFLHLNDKLASTDGDSLKNYYTYAYHIVNDESALTFSGMHYPFGEHFVYTDCQPLISSILRFFPFTHKYCIGILHFLMLFSFIITPNILYKLFQSLNVGRIPAFTCALAIGLLSPQIQRIGGHFALAYGCIIPLSYLLNIHYFNNSSMRNLIILTVYNLIVFFIHPYLGLGLAITSLLGCFFYFSDFKNTKAWLGKMIFASIPGLFPIIFFRVFMKLTDEHNDRPTEPFGIFESVAQPSTVFVPTYGPFEHLMKQIIPTGNREWEGLSYIGFFTSVLIFVTLLLFILVRKRALINKKIFSVFLVSVVLLLFSFGYLNLFCRSMGIDPGLLKQFRALGRFAWFFYFATPVLCVAILNTYLKNAKNIFMQKRALAVISFVFLLFNAIEGNHYLRSYSDNYLKSPNIFNARNLNESEKDLVHHVTTQSVKAILPLPLFYIGSEMFERDGLESAYMAMLLSFHCKKPLIAAMLSRTSINEAVTNMELLNEYKGLDNSLKQINDDSLLIVHIATLKKPNEFRLLNKLKPSANIHGITFYRCTVEDLKVIQRGDETVTLKKATNEKDLVYIHSENRVPFLPAKIQDYSTILEWSREKLIAGEYILSFHYHFLGKGHSWIDCNMVVEKKNGVEVQWEMMKPMRQASGFYNNYLVFEQSLKIDSVSDYKLFLNGASEKRYFISNVLLRPANKDVIIDTEVNQLINNYSLTVSSK